MNIAGAKQRATPPGNRHVDSGSTFAVVVSNTVGTVTSAAATLTVSAARSGPRSQPGPRIKPSQRDRQTFATVVAAWTATQLPVAEKREYRRATAASYTTPVTTTSNSGSTFAVVVSNTVGTVTSAAATLTLCDRFRSGPRSQPHHESDRNSGTASNLHGGCGRVQHHSVTSGRRTA